MCRYVKVIVSVCPAITYVFLLFLSIRLVSVTNSPTYFTMVKETLKTVRTSKPFSFYDIRETVLNKILTFSLLKYDKLTQTFTLLSGDDSFIFSVVSTLCSFVITIIDFQRALVEI